VPQDAPQTGAKDRQEDSGSCGITIMASPEIIRPNESEASEPRSSGSLGSQMKKYVGHDVRVPKGENWAFTLVNKIPDKQKNIVTSFISEIPHEDRQRAAKHLTELVDALGDQIQMSRYPEVEIGRCVDETRRWLKVTPREKSTG